MLTYKVTFSEDVTGVGTADFALSSDSTGETNGNNPVTSISGSGSVYYAEVSASTDGTYNLDLVSSGHGIADESSNPLTDTTPTGADETYTVSTTITQQTPQQLQASAVTLDPVGTPGPRDIGRIILTSATPGTIVATWEAPSEAPANYRISWAKAGDPYLTWTDSSGNAFPTDPAHTITGLEAGETYNVRVRASYSGTSGDWSGDVTITIAEAVTNTIVVPDTTVVTDTTAPTISSIERSNPSGATTESRTLTYKVTFSENVTGVGTADFALSPGSTGGTSTSSGQFTQTRSPSLAIPDNTTVSDAITVADSGTATSVTVAVDITHTYIGDLRIDLVAPDGTTKTLHNRLGGSIDDINQEYTPDFEGESIAGTWSLRISDNANFDSGTLNDWTLTINHGSSTASPVTSISGSSDTYYVTVSATTDGTYNLDLVSSRHGIADESSNPLTSTTPTGADETYTVSTVVTDTTAPTISSITRYNPSTATTDSQTLTYKVTFSEDVTGVGTADFALSSGSTGTGSITGLTGSGNTYHVTVSATTDGTYNLDLVSSGHDIADTASNPLTNTAPTGADETYTVSTTITQQTPQQLQASAVTLDPVGTPGPRDIGRIILTSATPGTIVATWEAPSEAPANYRISWAKAGDPYLTWTDSAGNAFPTDPAHTITGLEAGEPYKVKVRASYSGTSGDWSGDVTITITEAATNTIVVPDTTVVTDTTAPTISSITRYNPSTATTDSQTLTYKVTFSEDVTGVGTADFALSSDSTGETNGNNPVTSISGSGSVYYAEVSASTDGTYNLDLVSSGHGIADESSNPLANTTPTGADETYTVSTVVTDTTAPTISSIERSNPSGATTDSRTLVYRITFSEDVTGVGTADFALSSDSTGNTNGNNPVTSISGSGSVYYAEVSASTDGTYNLDLVSSGHGIADESSNPLANTTPTGADETYTVSTTVVNTTNPRLESIERYSPTSQNTNAQYLIYTATFSKSVTGVGASDFVLSPGSTGGGNNGSSPIAGISGSGYTYYVIISPAVGGTYNLDLVSSGHNIADAASNPLTNTTPTGADETYTVS